MEENKALVGHVHSLETFGLVDGPGVRTVVFLQGCRMRCRYCHNPEAAKNGPQRICSTGCTATVRTGKITAVLP